MEKRSLYRYLLFYGFVSLVKLDIEPTLPAVTGNLPDYATLCPLSVCNSSQSENLQIKAVTSCCQICSCALDCYKVANCCPDVPLNKSSEPEYPCVDISHLLNNERLVEYRTSGADKYRVVNKCPDPVQAAPGCQHPVSLQDYVPVSDTMYEKVYRNRHCALCHGVQEYTFWNLSANCADIASVSFETFEERDEYILKHCVLMAYHPEPKRADMSRCYQATSITGPIKSCNISGEWDYFDPGLEIACNNQFAGYNTVYIQMNIGLFTTQSRFSNVYCLLCNKPKHFRISHNCKILEMDAQRGTTVSFSAIIRFWPVETILRKAGQCRSMDVWDPFDAVCRPLLCPIDSIPVFGSCQSSSHYFEGYTMSVVFEVAITSPEKLEDPYVILRHIVDPLIKNITDKLGSNFHCGLCSNVYLFRCMNETNVYMDVPFYTTRYCTYHTLIAKLKQRVVRKEMTVTVNTLNGLFDVLLKPTLGEIDVGKRKVLYSVNRAHGKRFCLSAIQLTTAILQLCPRFELPELPEYNLSMSDINQARLKRQIENTMVVNPERETVSICAENYFILRELMRQRRNGCQQPWNDIISVIIFQILVYWSADI